MSMKTFLIPMLVTLTAALVATVAAAAAAAAVDDAPQTSPGDPVPQRQTKANDDRLPPDANALSEENQPSPEEIAAEDEKKLQRFESLEPERFTIDLAAALQLATSVNPKIGMAYESVREAMALDLGARAMLLPTLAAGTNFHYHDGKLQTSFGEIRTLKEQSVYFGGGARTLAAESLAVPAVRLFAHLGDAFYSPLAARQVVADAQFQRLRRVERDVARSGDALFGIDSRRNSQGSDRADAVSD